MHLKTSLKNWFSVPVGEFNPWSFNHTLYLESIQDGQAITLRTSGPIQFVSFSETNKKIKKFTVIDDKSDDYDAHQDNSQLQCSLQMNISYFSL